MVEMKKTCKDCVHKDVCRYAKDFEIICNSLIEVAKESVDKEYFQNLIDLEICCKQYVMAPYQELKTKREYAIDPLGDPFAVHLKTALRRKDHADF